VDFSFSEFRLEIDGAFAGVTVEEVALEEID